VKQLLKQNFSQSLLATSMCRPHPLNEGTPGGTAAIITDQLVNRKINIISDTTGLGRWSGATFQLPTYNLHIVTSYRPNQDNKINSNTTYQQQVRILQQQGVDQPNPSKQILTDLSTQIKLWHQQQDKVILMWDANDSLEHKSIQEFQAQTSLVSLLPTTPKEMSSYTRGHKVIDHILGSEDLAQQITKSGYLPFYEGAWLSDHRPAFIDIQINVTKQQQEARTNRNLTSNNHKAVTKYLNKLQSQTIITEMLQEILQLELKTDWTEEDHQQLEDIDQKLTKLLVTSEENLKSPYNNPWSPQLHEAYEIHRYWQIQKMRKNNKIKNTPTLLQLEIKYADRLYQGNASRSIYGQFYR
jgi:hypothetical protein